jgi:hypothetical protein
MNGIAPNGSNGHAEPTPSEPPRISPRKGRASNWVVRLLPLVAPALFVIVSVTALHPHASRPPASSTANAPSSAHDTSDGLLFVGALMLAGAVVGVWFRHEALRFKAKNGYLPIVTLHGGSPASR